MSTVGTVNLTAATETAQHYRSDDQPAAVAREKKQLSWVGMNSEEAAQKFDGLAIAERGMGGTEGVPLDWALQLGPGLRINIGFNLKIVDT
ncbi:unnamed protein product [Linum trigynum]|uniref:Uncharacterized protein n=1 Tax=Linum trigynum TaxID=586398 RepID=A0AAV2FHK9_9ROSI